MGLSSLIPLAPSILRGKYVPCAYANQRDEIAYFKVSDKFIAALSNDFT